MTRILLNYKNGLGESINTNVLMIPMDKNHFIPKEFWKKLGINERDIDLRDVESIKVVGIGGI